MSDVSGAPGQNVQYEPMLAQNDATVEEQVHGIVVQTEADLPGESFEKVRDVLGQRVAQAGLSGEDIDLDALAQQIVGRTDDSDFSTEVN